MTPKKILFTLFFAVLVMSFSGAAMADSHGKKIKMVGQVSEIDASASVFSIKDGATSATFKVNPFTEFELESTQSSFKRDVDIPFSDLKVGDWVKVKAYRDNQGNLMADDVDVRR